MKISKMKLATSFVKDIIEKMGMQDMKALKNEILAQRNNFQYPEKICLASNRLGIAFRKKEHLNLLLPCMDENECK